MREGFATEPEIVSSILDKNSINLSSLLDNIAPFLSSTLDNLSKMHRRNLVPTNRRPAVSRRETAETREFAKNFPIQNQPLKAVLRLRCENVRRVRGNAARA